MKRKIEEEPKVIIGDEVIKRRNKPKDSGSIVFGMLLLGVGAILLLINLGIVSSEIWNYIWSFWPLLLVLSGLHIILGDNLVTNMLMGILTIGLFLLVVVYGLYQLDSPLVANIPGELRNILNYLDSIKR